MKQRGFSWLARAAALAVALVAPVSSFAQQQGICDRTPVVEQAIRNLVAARLPHSKTQFLDAPCSAFTSEYLDLVTALQVSNAGPSGLKEGDFAGLRNLKYLLLGNNSLSSLPSGIFGGLDNLLLLALNGNRLSSLPSEVFGGLDNLVLLDLADNHLSSLSSGIFNGLTSLGLLKLGNNRLPSLPSGLFNGLRSLAGIALHGNHLSFLPAGLFRDLPLRVLYLHANRFQRLPAGLFTGLGGSGLDTVMFNELLAGSGIDERILERGTFPGLRFDANPKNAPRQHSFSVFLEVSESPRQAVVRIEEGVPSPTELTLTINGVERVLNLPVGADRATYPLPIERAVVALEAGTIGDPAIVRDFTGVDFSVARQEATLESARKVSIRASATSITEGRAATFTLTLDAGPGVPYDGLEVTVDMSGDGASTSSRGTWPVTIPAGSRTATFTVNARPDDESDQGDQTMTATVQSGNHAAAGTPSSARVTVREDADPVIEEAVSEVEGVSEAGETTVLPGTRVVLRGRASDVNTDQSLTTAWNGPPQVTLAPVTAGQSEEVMFTAPAMLGHYTFTFSADDDGDGGDAPVTRKVVVEVVSGRGVSIRAASSSPVLEDEAEEIVFEVRTSLASTTSLIVNVTLSGGAAFGIENASQTVTIVANETTGRFTVPIDDDAHQQGNGALRAEVKPGTGYLVVAPSHARVAILDDESLLDVNADGSVNANDALILYYAWALRKQVGNGR